MRWLRSILPLTVFMLLSTSCLQEQFDAAVKDQVGNPGKAMAAAMCFYAERGRYPGSLNELNGFHCNHPFAQMDYDPTYFEWVDFMEQPDGRLDVRWKPAKGRGSGIGFIGIYPGAATRPAGAPLTQPLYPSQTRPSEAEDMGHGR